MSDQGVDLAKEINNLKKRRVELDELWKDPPGPTEDEKEDQTEIIENKLVEIDEKILSLKNILNNQQASQIIIRGLTQEEKKQMNQALAALSLPIQRDQAFQVIMDTLTTIFQGIELIATKA